MQISNRATTNPSAGLRMSPGASSGSGKEYKVRAMPGKLRPPAVSPEKTRGMLFIVLAILIIGGLVGGEVYLFLTKPDVSSMKGQISEQEASIAKFGKKLEDQTVRTDSLGEQIAGLPSKEEFEAIKTTLASLEAKQKELDEKMGLADSDQDSMPDVWEEKYGLNPKDRRDAKLDTDKDKLINFYEYLLDCDPTNKDTDGDGHSDGAEVAKGYNPKGKGKLDEILKVELTVLIPKEEETKESNEEEKASTETTTGKDTDQDGMPDDWENKYGLNPNDPVDAKEDLDKDALTNLDEYKFGCNPASEDTDNDGYLDGQEVSTGYNPAGEGKLGEIEKLEEEVKTIEEKIKEAENGILEKTEEKAK